MVDSQNYLNTENPNSQDNQNALRQVSPPIFKKICYFFHVFRMKIPVQDGMAGLLVLVLLLKELDLEQETICHVE